MTPAAFVRAVSRSYRRDFWNHQPARVQVWSEKGTVRGVLAPVLDRYGVGFSVMHGFNSATKVYEIAQDDDGRNLIALYVGDYDPSGLCMSERDLPARLAEYGGDHVVMKRIALTREQLDGLPSFPATDKKKDTRYKWFVRNSGDRCWELDALDPNDLREIARSFGTQSSKRSSRLRGAGALISRRPSENRCEPCSTVGRGRHNGPQVLCDRSCRDSCPEGSAELRIGCVQV
jgi:hypothetical protein